MSSQFEPPPVIVSRHKPQRATQASWALIVVALALGAAATASLVWVAVKPSELDKVKAAFAESAKKEHDADRALTDEAKRVCLRDLKRFGIAVISDDAVIVRDSGDLFLVGSARDTTKQLRKFAVKLDHAQFGTTSHWKLLAITIDQKLVYESPD